MIWVVVVIVGLMLLVTLVLVLQVILAKVAGKKLRK